MSARAQTVRLTPPQQRALVAFAKQRGLSEYAMLARVVDAGLASLIPGTLVLWLLGAFAFHVGSGLIHILLVPAVIAFVYQLVTGRRSV